MTRRIATVLQSKMVAELDFALVMWGLSLMSVLRKFRPFGSSRCAFGYELEMFCSVQIAFWCVGLPICILLLSLILFLWIYKSVIEYSHPLLQLWRIMLRKDRNDFPFCPVTYAQYKTVLNKVEDPRVVSWFGYPTTFFFQSSCVQAFVIGTFEVTAPPTMQHRYRHT
jgi:hypothetical protein